jgi:hypothetical protein
MRVLRNGVLTVPGGVRYATGSGDALEYRRSPRFSLRLPVLTRWTDVTGKECQGAGFSRDICLSGIFIVSSEPPPKGTPIFVTVVLPNPRAAAQELHLRSKGFVVRVEQGEATGFAVNCDFSGIEQIFE